MKPSLKRIAVVVASALLLTLALKTWAAPGAAHVFVRGGTLWSAAQARNATQPRGTTQARGAAEARTQLSSGASALRLPFAVRFREAEGRGLLVNAWVNNQGPYTFAIDTGAGATLLSERAARGAGVSYQGRQITIGGLSGAGNATGREAKLDSLAIGDRENFLPSQSTVVVTGRLPEGIDGVLDPTESYWPLGYTIDLPNATITAFDPRSTPLRAGDVPPGGAVVPWIIQGANRRPFVRLDNGRRALIDTGSGFGLALSEREAQSMGLIPRVRRSPSQVRDLGGGSVAGHRITPLTVRIGALTLRNVPTDLLTGVEAGAPIIIGRDALYPFKLSFDPVNRLIQISPK